MSDILDDLKMMADKIDSELGAVSEEPGENFLSVLLIRAIGEIRKLRCSHASSIPTPIEHQGTAPAFPERDKTRPAEDQGLFRKFDVHRVDGSDRPGGKHHGCEYFVLDVNHDPHAPAALLAYAQDCATTHPKLSADLIQRYGLQVPTPAEVPMPEPVAYGIGNTAITGQTNRLMMVRIVVPLDDQYAGSGWHPLVLADEARTYGERCRAAGETAGYARGLKEARLDVERLDRLDIVARRYPRPNGQHIWSLANLENRLIGPTLRDAIDAALREETS